MKLKIREQDIVNSILDLLALFHIKAIHHRTTGQIFSREGKTCFGRTRADQKGAPDILFSYKGFPIALEVKAPDGRVRPDQSKWGSEFNSEPNSGHYHIVRSTTEVQLILDEIDRLK